MPVTNHPWKLIGALLLGAATGPAVGQGMRERAAEVTNPQPSGTVALPHPCPAIALPVTTPRTFLVINRTSQTLSCRTRTPEIGGWSGFTTLPAGAHLIDQRLELDEIQVQCKPPARTTAVRVFPGRRYHLLREVGQPEVRLMDVEPKR